MNSKGADQTVRIPRLVCTCVIHNPPKTGFLGAMPINSLSYGIFRQMWSGHYTVVTWYVQ